MTEDEALNAKIESELNAQIDAELQAKLARKLARHPIQGPGDPKAEAARRGAMDAGAKVQVSGPLGSKAGCPSSGPPSRATERQGLCREPFLVVLTGNRDCGYRVVEAVNTSEAITMLAESNRPFEGPRRDCAGGGGAQAHASG
jgi:hypothetical protein